MIAGRRRVVWYEGMALDPQHLQQGDRHHAGVAAARARTLFRYEWGLTRLEFDRDRLANGEVVVLAAAGILPDGLVFDVPEYDVAPAPRPVADAFSGTAERLPIYLALPAERLGEPNVGRNGAAGLPAARREMRFSSDVVTTADESGGGDVREIEVALPNFQLRLGSEALDGYVAVRIAEVLRQPGGAFVFDDAFIPTSLRLVASPHLVGIGRRLVELLVAQRTALAERRQGLLRKTELSPADVAVLNLYEVVNRYLPEVAHLVAGDGATPEALYLTMLALTGSLAAWSPAAGPRAPDLPAYEHNDLTGCYARLTPILWTLLGEAAPSANFVEVPLVNTRQNLHVAQTDADLLTRASWFLHVAARDPADEGLLRDLPILLRVSSPQTIDSVLRSATRALPIEEPPRPPPGVPIKTGAKMIALHKRGPFWDTIQQGNGIAVFVPAELSRLEIKLYAVFNA